MKALFIYNEQASGECAVISRAKNELKEYITTVKMQELSAELRPFVRATPCLITVEDQMQGDELIKDGADGNLIVTAKLQKRLEEEEKEMHESESFRLDNLIKHEKTKSIDEYTMDLIIEGVIA